VVKRKKVMCAFKRAVEIARPIVLAGHQGRLDFVKVIDQNTIISGSWDGVREWNIADQSGRILRENKADLSCIVRLSDGRIALASWEDHTIRIWDLKKKAGEPGCCQILRGHYKQVTGFAQFDDGRIVSASLDGTIRVWDLSKDPSDFGFVLVYQGTEHLLRNIFTLNNDIIVFSDWDKRTRVLYLKDRSVQLIKKAGGSCLLSDGTVLVGGSSGKARIFDFVHKNTEENEICLWQAHSTMIALVRELSDRRIVTASDDRTIRVWDLSKAGSDGYLQTYEGHTKFIISLLPIAHDRLISGSEDFTVRLWDLSGERIKKESSTVFKGHQGWVRCLDYLDDGRIVSGADDKTIRIWQTIDYFKAKVIQTQNKIDYEIDGPGVFEILFPE
jgi:WD40 repeat protein